jgi:hypothetical protein
MLSGLPYLLQSAGTSTVKDFSVTFSENNNISLIDMAPHFHELYLLLKHLSEFICFSAIAHGLLFVLFTSAFVQHHQLRPHLKTINYLLIFHFCTDFLAGLLELRQSKRTITYFTAPEILTLVTLDAIVVQKLRQHQETQLKIFCWGLL